MRAFLGFTFQKHSCMINLSYLSLRFCTFAEAVSVSCFTLSLNLSQFVFVSLISLGCVLASHSLTLKFSLLFLAFEIFNTPIKNTYIWNLSECSYWQNIFSMWIIFELFCAQFFHIGLSFFKYPDRWSHGDFVIDPIGISL